MSRVEHEHEMVERLLDRLEARHPGVDEETLNRLEDRLAGHLEPAYRELFRSVAGPLRLRLRGLLGRPGSWAARIRALRDLSRGSPRWWVRMRDLECRMREQFSQLEDELGELLVKERSRTG